MFSYDSSRIVLTTNNGLATGLSSVGSLNNNPVFEYPPLALIDMGAMYRNRRWQFSYDFLDLARQLVTSDEYEFFAIAIPSNNIDSNIPWKGTYRTQFFIPEGSFLIGILGCAN